MRVTKGTYAGKTLEMLIEDEDLAVADIVHHEILKNGEVVFAGAIPTHPLLKKIILKVQTKGIKPIDAVVAGGERAAENVAEILSEAKKAIGEKAGKVDD